MAKADITVHDRTYSVACAPGQERRLKTLAGELDHLVRKIAAAVGNVGDDRLLLVAALSLLEDLHDARTAGNGTGGPGEQAAAAALVDAAARIEAMAARVENRLSPGNDRIDKGAPYAQ